MNDTHAIFGKVTKVFQQIIKASNAKLTVSTHHRVGYICLLEH